MHLALTAHRHLHPFAQGVHHRDANAVQTAGHLVTTGAKLAAGMQHGEHRLQGALAGARVHIGGNAAAVVAHRGGTVFPQHHNNAVAMARQGFINRVINNFVHQMVQAPRPGGADVHARALAYGLKPLQHLNLLGAVGVLDLGSVAHSESLKPGNRVMGGRNGSKPRPDNVNLPPAVYRGLQRPLSAHSTPGCTPSPF